ncbi:hypothetical protein ACPB8Q_03590 [Methanocaldococcus indicus]|uniref:hypothetical protein n=1 Tax=Methanocaldococcus indicus TaxID=213231 RepID=UPI003C6D1667
MKSKELAKKVLIDLYKNLDEFSKDIIRGDLADIEFKGFYLKGKNGKRFYIRDLDDYENLEDFEVKEREYWIKSVNLKKYEDGLIIITLSSKDSNEYKFINKKYKIYHQEQNKSLEFRERILKWFELDEDELDDKIVEFDTRANNLSQHIREYLTHDLYIYMDVFMNENNVENYIEEDEDKIILWIHPVFLFSSDEVIKGLLAYELSKYNKEILEKFYREIVIYCRELYSLTYKKLKILKELKSLAKKYNDLESLKIIEELEK